MPRPTDRLAWYVRRLDPDGDPQPPQRQNDDGTYDEAYDLEQPSPEHPANVVSSLCEDGQHRPVLDIDMPVVLMPSSTPGHHHLYLNTVALTWDKYAALLDVLADCGIIEQGYADASIRRGQTVVRRPGVPRIEPRPSSIIETGAVRTFTTGAMTVGTAQPIDGSGGETTFREAIEEVTANAREVARVLGAALTPPLTAAIAAVSQPPLTLSSLVNLINELPESDMPDRVVVSPEQWNAIRSSYEERPLPVSSLDGYNTRIWTVAGVPVDVHPNGVLLDPTRYDNTIDLRNLGATDD